MEFWEKPPIDELYHYGTPRHSGRYPWGSGEDPYQHEKGYGGVVNNLLKAGLKPEELQKWSGSNPYTAEVAFKKKYQELKKSGKSEVDIAKELGMKSTTELRDQLKDYTNKIKNWEIETALAMRHQNIPDAQIAKAIGRPNESSVRTLLADHRIQKKEFASGTVDFLRKQVDAKGMIDVSTGVERELGITAGKFQQAVRQLRSEGYEYYKGRMEQITNPGKFTSMSVLCAPGTAYGDIYDWEKVASVNDYISDDRGDSFRQKWVYPASMDSSRLHIRYKDELDKDGHTGIERDGLIEIRPGVKDLSLGNAQYAQVRILVDGTHYLKGMAIYSNNLPDGVDVVFNTNKPKEKGLTGTLKSIADNIKSDPTNPFGAVLRQDGGQTYYVGDDGKQHLSLINKTREEGDWSDWADKLPSQFLAKQSLQLIRTQLKDTVADKEAEYQEIMHLTNPTVKKNLLNEFAEGCDTDARDLSAIALPHQKYKVLIPIPDMKDGEVYAPHLENGDTVALVRFPHEGTFQIAKCTVNNENPMAKEYIGNGKNGKLDAIGVNASTAAQLSGADFDGDTAMVIPCDSEKYPVHIDARRYFEELQNFDAGESYPEREGMRYMTKKDIQKEMGMISNLIMDMTLADCSTDELIRATKHSMTVIDAYKHKYDYKLSEEENRIAELKEKYQGKHIGLDGKEHGGAATIITRAKSPERVEKTQGTPSIDPTTGEKVYKLSIDRFHPVNDYDKPTGMMTIRTVDGKKIVYNTKDPAEVERYAPVKTVEDEKGKMHFGPDITNKAGDIHYRVGVTTEETHSMDRVRDAMQLVRDPSNEKELEYARYANSMKSLANKARLDALSVEENPRNNEAYQEYNIEVQSLRAKLNEAELNAPRERAAQRIAQGEIKIAIENNPALSDDKKMLKKISDKALQRAREATGAARHTINIEDREWEAIQKNAISKTELNKILKYADGTRVRELAMPRSNNGISPSKQARIKSYVAQGREIAEIANILGVSQSTVAKYMSSKS